MLMEHEAYLSKGLRPACCGSSECREIMVEMSDGVRLRTKIITPDTEGPYHTIFTRSCYPAKEEIFRYQGKIFSERGYAFVYQYSRGMAGSEGEWSPFENERQDGIDTVRWLAGQPFVKDLALYGLSYMGFVQWIILDEVQDLLKTAYIEHFGVDRYGQMYADGLFRHDIYTPWAMNNNGKGRTFDFSESLKAGLYRPHVNADRDVWDLDLPWYRDWITHTDRSDRYWTESFWETLYKVPPQVHIPVCLVAGWYDHHFGGMIKGYEMLPEETRKQSRLVIGPWIHFKDPCVHSYDTENAFIGEIYGYEDVLRWMDRSFGIFDSTAKPGALTYCIGADWEDHAAWPVESGSIKFCLNSKGILGTAPETQVGTAQYAYDPQDPIMTSGAECMCYSPAEIRGSVLQPDLSGRKDIISFVSDELEEGMTVAGKAEIRLSVSSDADDTAFIVRLIEQKADGRCYNIRTGAATLAYRNGAPKAMEYKPGEIVECRFELWDILWRFEKGTRLRLDIQSSSFPEYNVHTNYAGVWSLQDKTRTAMQTVYFGGDHRSEIVLPIKQKRR